MLKEMIKINNVHTSEWVGQAVETLSHGGVVGFPTETVYGLAAAPGVPGAIEKLNLLKQRPAEKPYTLHIGSPRKLCDYVPNPSWPVRVLTRKGWPGPITLVAELTADQVKTCRETYGSLYDQLYFENSIGLRCPNHPTAIALLSQCTFPVVAPSANPADMPPALDAQQVEQYFGDQVDLVLDAGPVQYRKASTVVKVGQCGYEILREGVIDRRGVDRLMNFTILFVCSGNTCRSPMAEALCRKVLPRIIGCREEDLSRLKINIASAGTFAMWNLPPSRNAATVMAKMGIDLSGHHSQPVTANLVSQADIIFVMSPEHKDFICDLVPGATNRVRLLSESGVPDPIGGSDDVYIKCAQNLEHLIEARLKELL